MRSVLKFGNVNFETTSSSSSDTLMYGEKTKDMIFTKNYSYVTKLDEIDKNRTTVELNIFLEYTTMGTFMKSFILRAITKTWENKLKNLHKLTHQVN